MNVLDRLKTGYELTVRSLRVIEDNRKLMAYPILMLAVSALVAPLFLVAIIGGISPEAARATFEQDNPGIVALAGIFAAWLVFTFISTFFSTALVHASYTAFSGGEPDIGRSLHRAMESLGAIVVWSLIAATVGLIMQRSDRESPGLTTLFSAAWAALTFFVIPVIALERTSVRGMFSRSASIFRERWGESAVGIVGAGVVQFAISLVGAALMAAAWFLLDIQIIVPFIAVVTATVGFLVSTTLNGVIKTALYLYASEEYLPAELEDIDPDRLVRYRSGNI
ncbi:MAG: DUF6159 family protein [Chloroflexota bacterium]